jgi:M6 family metalloprotease-like protein
MKTISNLVLFFFIISLPTIELFAVPAYPYPMSVTQPDGTTISIRLHGDEYFNYKTTLDGFVLVPDQNGVLTYGKFDTSGNIVSTSFKATNIEKRSAIEREFVQTLQSNPDFSRLNKIGRALRAKSQLSGSAPQKSYPLIGSPKSLVILVNFSDLSFVTSTPKTSFTNLLNQSGYSANGGTGSAKDYFNASSMGAFNPQFDVVGPFTLARQMSFYGSNDSSGNDSNPRQMVIDACTAAAASGVDFSQYDTDKDGIVDNVFIYYAGYNEAESGPANSIWPHRWTLADYSTKFNGVSIYDYACTSELRGYSGSNMCGVGTFCHEFGHVLGLPDYYVTSGTDHHTLSTWNIMDYGPYLNLGRTPPSYSAWDRFFLNWATPTELKVAGNYKLDTLSTSNKSYLISQTGNHNLIGSNPSPVEFFVLENRQKKGWDAYLPGHGMLAYHIYYNSSTWADNSVNNSATAMGVDIVEADGVAITETSSTDPTLAGDPYPGTSSVTSFYPTLRSGVNIQKPLLNITETNGQIFFHFGNNIALVQNLQAFSTVQGTPSAAQTVKVSGSKLTTPINIAFNAGTHFEMKKETDTTWGKSLILTPTSDSLVASTNIQIRYNPTVPSYIGVHSDIFTLTTTNGDYASASVSGTSTRAVYVVPPIASEATNTTFTSFIANWNNVFDAVGYYLTVYTVSDGESSFTQGFDSGTTAPHGWTITPTTSSSSTVYSGNNIPSVLFSNTGEYIQTELYPIPVTKLSFYIRSLAGDNGGFLVQALNNQSKWEKVDSISIVTTLNEKAKTYTFAESKGYNRFKFTYYKGIGSVAFDDVTTGFSQLLSYNLNNVWVNNNVDTLTNLIPNTQYFYKVAASDLSIYYENITDFSNLISVNTLSYPFDKKLVATVKSSGEITVYLPTVNTVLYVYNTLGQTIRIITPQSTTVQLDDLPKNQVYILKAGNYITKIVN